MQDWCESIIHEINPIEALDIDTEHEFLLAEKLADEVKKYKSYKINFLFLSHSHYFQ